MSAEESQELDILLRKNDLHGQIFWIGLIDTQFGGIYIWNGSGGVANYTNWVEGQPTGFVYDYDLDELINADCVYLSNDGSTWGETSCNYSNFRALCQRGL